MGITIFLSSLLLVYSIWIVKKKIQQIKAKQWCTCEDHDRCALKGQCLKKKF